MSLFKVKKIGLHAPVYVPPITVAVNFGGKTLQGFGGEPTTEAANSAPVGGTFSTNFKFDALSNLVPCDDGSISLGSAWTEPSGTGTVIGGSGTVYAITIVANAFHVTFLAADTNVSNQLQTLIGLSTAANGPALGDTIFCRDGQYNPLNGNWSLSPPVIAAITGSGSRVTVRAENPDTTLDVYGNLNRQHGAKVGQIYWDPFSSSGAYPYDFRDLWITSNPTVEVGGASLFFASGSGNGTDGLGFYNCRVEFGLATTDASTRTGFIGQGDGTIDGCLFLGLGTAILWSNQIVLGTTLITNNHFRGLTGDGLQSSGNGISFKRNFGNAWASVQANHADWAQQLGTGGSWSIGEYSENICVQDLSGELSTGFRIADIVAPNYYSGFRARNNLVYINTTVAVAIGRADNPDIQWNTLLTDPFCPATTEANTYIKIENDGGINGATINGNVVNGLQYTGQSGTVIDTNNTHMGNLPNLDVTTRTDAQILATIQIMYPGVVGNQTDPKWGSRLGVLEMFTPAQTAVAAGGCKNPDGSYRGYLFPATTGNVIGPKNDGSIFMDPADPVAWLAAHQPAT